MSIQLKRIYSRASDDDGVRIFVERLWPRGVSKANAALDHWARDVAPSAELRKWYAHEADRWSEFRARYVAELEQLPEIVEDLLDRVRGGTVTLLFASREEEQNSVSVLRGYLESRLKAAEE